MTEALTSAAQRAQADARSKWIALVILCAAVLMIVLDQTIVNVALPSIQDDLGFNQSSLAWVVNAYLIPFGGLLLLAGRLGDLLSRKGVFMVGIAVFTLASLLCGVAQSQEMLIGARFLQGVGGALSSAVVLGMIVTMFPEPRDQAKAIGVYSFVASAGGAIGLLLGGVLTEALNWHWIFIVNVPIGLATALLAIRLVRGDRGIGLGDGADFFGAAMLTAALMLGVYTVVEVPDYGWGALHTLGLGAVSLALLTGFFIRQSRAANPLVPLRIFRNANVRGANLIQALMISGLFGVFFLGALYMERVLGWGPLEIGLGFLPVAVLIGLMSIRFAEPLIMRFGARATLIAGLSFLLAGVVWFARIPVDANYAIDMLPTMILMGAGAGLSFPSMMTLAMSGAGQSDSGLASGLINTSIQVGGALSLALLVTLSTTRTENLLGAGESAAEALTGGYRVAWIVAAGLLTVALAAAITLLKPITAPQAAEDGELEAAYSEAA